MLEPRAATVPESRPLLEALQDANLVAPHVMLPGLYTRAQGSAMTWDADLKRQPDGSWSAGKIPIDYTWGTVASLGLPGTIDGVGCGLLFHTRGDPVIGSYTRVDFTPWFRSPQPPNRQAWLVIGLRGSPSAAEPYVHTDGTRFPVDLGPAGQLWCVPDIVVPMPATGFAFGSETNGIRRAAGEVEGYVAAWFPDDPAWVGRRVWLQVAVAAQESPLGIVLTDARVVTLGWPYPKYDPAGQRWRLDGRYAPGSPGS